MASHCPEAQGNGSPSSAMSPPTAGPPLASGPAPFRTKLAASRRAAAFSRRVRRKLESPGGRWEDSLALPINMRERREPSSGRGADSHTAFSPLHNCGAYLSDPAAVASLAVHPPCRPGIRQSSLRDVTHPRGKPGVETPGYRQTSLRDDQTALRAYLYAPQKSSGVAPSASARAVLVAPATWGGVSMVLMAIAPPRASVARFAIKSL